MTTAKGQRLAHTDDSQKVGDRGPTLMDPALRDTAADRQLDGLGARILQAKQRGG